jgi:hypothetical protein
MVTNIRTTDKPIEITGIGGEPVKINQVGDLMGYVAVYYHPDIAANILSFYKLTKRFKSVVYDNKKKDAFVVERDDGSHMEFILSREGLYHYDFNLSIKSRLEKENQPSEKAMVIQTVEGVKRNFMKKEIESADKARRLYVILRGPSQKSFKDIIQEGKIINNSVTIQDYRNA